MQGVSRLFGPEVEMLDEYLDEQRYLFNNLKLRDIKSVANFKLKFSKYWLRQKEQENSGRARQAAASVRYLKRSTNQLIKSLRALKVT